MKHIIVFVFFSLLSLRSVVAQSDPNAQIVRDSRVLNPLLPTPDMALLGKFGDVAFEKSMGTASHSIPIYTVNYDGVSIPLQLQYSSSGFRPSDPGSYLGLHWMINGVGGISRQIMGEADENGYLLNSVNQSYINTARANANTLSGQSLIQQFNNGIDISQDVYNVSTSGVAGRFFINSQKQFDFSVKTDQKLTYQLSAGTPPLNNIKFFITDTKGNKYEFGEEERTVVASQNGYSRTSVSSDGVTSWKLSRITTASGKEILFGYSTYNFSYTNRSHDVFTYKSSSTNPGDGTTFCGCSQDITWRSGTNLYSFTSKILTSITTPNEVVEFSYADDLSADYYKKKLTGIQVKDYSNKTQKKYEFTYGYYAGSSRLKLTGFQAVDPLDVNNYQSYAFNYYEDYTTPDMLTRGIDAYKYFNGATNTSLIVSAEPTFTGPSADRSVRPLYAQQTLLKEIIYPTKGKTRFVYEANGDVAANNLGGGLRVKELLNYNDNVLVNRKVFAYRNYSGPRLLLNNVPYNVYSEYANPDNGACARLVLTSDNQYGDVQNTIPVPEDYFYQSVDEIVKGTTEDIKTTYQFASMNAMEGDQQIRPESESHYKLEGGSFVLNFEKFYEYELAGISAYPNQVFQFAKFPGVLTTYKAYPGEGASQWCFTDFGGPAQSYPRFRSTIRLKKIINRQYQAGNYIQTTTEMTYTSVHEMPRTVKTTDSKGIEITKQIYYPYEASLIASPSLTTPQLNVFSAMVTNNIVSIPIAEEVIKGPNTVPLDITDGTRTIYNLFNGYYRPQEIYDRDRSGGYYRVHNFLGYDVNGNLVSSQKEADVINSYVWDFKGMYPIAHVINAPAKDVFYSSFEDAEGNSSTGDAKAGYKSRTGGYSRSLTSLTNGNYVLTYWQKSGGAWSLQTTAVTVSGGSYTINLGGQVDDVRFHPVNARMITFTYEPLLGILSQADAAHQYSYYTYDGLGRLILIRDANQFILKKFCYNYFGQPEACPVVVSTQWQPTGLTRCQPCPANPVYTTNIQEHQEIDNNPASHTYNTYRWVSDGVSSNCSSPADWQNTTTPVRCQLSGANNTGYQEQEQKDLNPCSPTYNQTRWIQGSYNTSACPVYTCTTGNCSGNDKKCINNVCTTGTLVCVSSVMQSRNWLCTWRYCFSDGTLSTYSFTTTSPTACMVLDCGY